MGKTGSWMHSIKKAVRKHLHGDLDPYKFQHLPAKGTTPRAHSDCSTASSHVGDEHYLEDRQSGSSSLIAGGSDHKQEEKRRSSTSSQVPYGGSGHHEKWPNHDDVTTSRSDTASSQANGGSGHHTYEELLKDDFPPSSSRSCEKGSGNHNYKVEISDSGHHRDAERRRGERTSGDHCHLVKLYREERAGPSTSYNPFYDRSNKEENGRSSTSSEKVRGVGEELSGTANEKENPRYSTGGRGGHNEEKRRPSISSQKERSDHEKPPVDKGRLSNASSAHHERSTVEKARSSTSSNHKVKTSIPSSDNRRPSTPSSPDDRTKSLLNENWKMPSENRRLSTDKGRPKTPSSPRVTFVTPAVSTETILLEKSISIVGPAASQALKSPSFGAPTPASPYAQQGRSIAVQDFLKPPSFDRKSSSSSTTSMYQAGGSTRSITSDGSNSSEDFLELVFPLSDPYRMSPSFKTSVSTNQRKKIVIATVHDLFSSHQYEAPVSPGSQRRKSGNFSPKPVVPLPELGTKPLLPANYRKQQAPVAVPVADLGAIMFHAGDAGAGGMLREWAAVLIQSSWRRYIARRSFKAQRGLLKLQALVRGYLVRKRIKPLVNARIQAARVRNKLSRNTKVGLHHVSNEYGISQTLLDNQSCQYGSAQPVLDDLPTPATRKSSRTRDPLKCDVSDWNSPVTLCTLAELKQEVLMKKQRAKQQQTLSSTRPEGQNPELRTESTCPFS